MRSRSISCFTALLGAVLAVALAVSAAPGARLLP